MKVKADEEYSESVAQLLGAFDWILVQIVLNVRARTAVGLRQYLAQLGIDIPNSIAQSPKWLSAFLRAPSVAEHQDGFEGLLRDRLVQLGFDEDKVREAINGLRRDVTALCLDVESAVAKELRRDLEASGVVLSSSIFESSNWREVFGRQQAKLPRGAALLVQTGTDASIFLAVEESSTCTLTQTQ